MLRELSTTFLICRHKSPVSVMFHQILWKILCRIEKGLHTFQHTVLSNRVFLPADNFSSGTCQHTCHHGNRNEFHRCHNQTLEHTCPYQRPERRTIEYGNPQSVHHQPKCKLCNDYRSTNPKLCLLLMKQQPIKQILPMKDPRVPSDKFLKIHHPVLKSIYHIHYGLL